MEEIQLRLSKLEPEWLNEGSGLRFRCPCDHGEHKLTVWFINPLGGDVGSLSEGRADLFFRFGEDFEDLGFYPPVTHGDCRVFVTAGVVDLIYL